MTLKLERQYGKHIPCRVTWVDFVSANTDILVALVPGPLRLRQVEPGKFSGKIFGVKISIERESHETADRQGRVRTLTDIALPWGLGETYAKATQTYYAIHDGLTSVDLNVEYRTSGLLTLYAFCIRQRLQRFLESLLEATGYAASILEHGEEDRRNKLDEDQRQRIAGHRAAVARASRQPQSAEGSLVASLSVDEVKDVLLVCAEAVMPDKELLTARAEIQRQPGVLESFLEGAHRLAMINNPANVSRGATVQRPVNVPFRQAALEFGHRLYQHHCTAGLASLMPVILHYGSSAMLHIEVAESLENLPWEAMHDGHDFLSLKVRFARALGAVTEVTRRADRDSLHGILLIGADSEGDLPGAEVEAEQIGQYLAQEGIPGVEVVTGQQANRKNILQLLESRDFIALHFSGHSIFDASFPWQSHLRLNQGTHLYVDDLRYVSRHKPWASGLNLVFLNSCESGRVGLDEVTGRNQSMCRVLRESGVANVVGMLWNVNDEAAVALATVFYRHIIEERTDPVEAMRLTRRRIAIDRAWADGSWLAPIIYA